MNLRVSLKWVIIGSMLLTATFLKPSTVSATNIISTSPSIPVSLRVPDTDLDVGGCVSPNSLVTVMDGVAVVGTALSASTGVYSISLLSQGVGIHDINVFYEDSYGQVSTTSQDYVYLAPKSLTTRTVNPSPTARISETVVTLGKKIVFQGSGCPNKEILLNIDNNMSVTTISKQDGSWRITIDSTGFHVGYHVFRVSAYGGSYTSSVSSKYQFKIVEAEAEAEPTTNTKITQQNITSSVVDPKNNYVSSSRELVISGQATPNTMVEVYVDDELVGSVYSNTDGIWSIVIYMVRDTVVVKTRACTLSMCSGFSDSVKYFLAESTHSQDCSASLKLNRYSYNLESGHTGIDLDIITEGFSDQYDKTIDWGDVAISHQTSELNSERLHHVYPGIGHYNGHVSVSDKLCGLTVYFTVNIYSGKPAPWRLITIIVLIIISLNLAHRTIVKLKRPV